MSAWMVEPGQHDFYPNSRLFRPEWRLFFVQCAWRRTTGRGDGNIRTLGGVILSVIISLTVTGAHATPLKICEDTEDFAPFMYRVTDAKGEKSGDLQGVTIDLIRQLEKKLNRTIQFDLIPWKRCMAMVERGDYDMAADAYFDEERATRFSYSAAYFTLTPQIFFSTRRWPKGFPATSTHQLDKFHGCGVLGYSYAHYGVKASDLDLGAKDHEQLIGKLMIDRCDYFFEELEIMIGFNLLGKHYLEDPALGHQSIRDAREPSLYFMVSRSSKKDTELLINFDKAINDLKREGKIATAAKWRTAPN